jgi:uncharacterized tellurite resistance protein B-like protein
MSFTHEEKKAISKILGDLIKADGKVDLGEAEMLYIISSEIGVNTQIQDEAMQMKSEDAIIVLQQMPDKKRAQVARYLHTMADSDGRLDPKEMEIILKVINRD